MVNRNSVIYIYLFLVYLLLYNEAKSYRAVVVIHGVLTGSDSMEIISKRIQEVGAMKLVTAKQSLWSLSSRANNASRL